MPIYNKGRFKLSEIIQPQFGNNWPTAQVTTTSDVIEAASNLYFTNARVYSNVLALLPTLAGSGITIQANGQISSSGGTVTFGSISQYLTTSNVSEGSNLYYTNTRVLSALTGNVTVGNLTATSIVINTSVANSYTTAGNVNAGNVIATTHQGNIWLGIYTANVSESASNLYYTNTRVYSNVIALLPTLAGSGIQIQANGQISASTATVSLAGLTTSNLAEGTNLYYTNSRTISAFTAGAGIAITSTGTISTKGADTGSGMFNSGLNLSNALVLSNTYANLVTFSSSDGASFILYSLHLSNFSSNTAYVNARMISGSNTLLFANLLEIPGSSVTEFLLKPQVYKANDTIQMQSLDNTLQPANNLITALASFQGSTDAAFDRGFLSLANNTASNLFISTSKKSIIESLKVVNTNYAAAPVSVYITDASLNLYAYLAANVQIPGYSSLELCELPKALPENYIIRAQQNGTGTINLFSTSKYTTQYIITPTSTSFAESGSVTFNITTLNLANGTTLYYTLRGISGNVNQNDFITANTGSFTISNDVGAVTLQANADLTTYAEGNETFVFELRKISTSGAVVASSDTITLQDTSNVVTFTASIAATSGANILAANSNLTTTISSVNLGATETLYYTTTGNAISSDFIQGNVGGFVLSNGAANLVLTANNVSNIKVFALQVRQGSNTGTVLYTSSNITLYPTNQLYTSASGGANTLTISDGGVNYKVHVFTTSANLNITSVGQVFNTIEYIAVAGGGGGGGQPGSYPNGDGGAGGGAGGVIFGNVAATIGNVTMSVGGGGGNAPATPGSNTGVFSNLYMQAMGGGSGGRGTFQSYSTGPFPGSPGGSGGGDGGNYNFGFGAGLSFPGQGQPGGAFVGPNLSSVIPGGNFGGGGGFSERGANAINSPGGVSAPGKGGNGYNISWMTPSYGSLGPVATSGTWFAGGGSGGGSNSARGGLGGGGGNLDAGGLAGNINSGGGGAGNQGPGYYGYGGGSGIIIIRYRT